MARVLAVANQKGGVAKTTTVHALGVALARLGDRVLLVDLDPQACLTFSVGLDPDELAVSLHDVLVGRNKGTDAVHDLGELSIIPSSIDLAGTELFLLGRTGSKNSAQPRSNRCSSASTPCSSSAHRRSACFTVNGIDRNARGRHPAAVRGAGAPRCRAALLDTMADVCAPATEPLSTVSCDDVRQPRHGREVIGSTCSALRSHRARATGAQVGSLRQKKTPAGVSILDRASGSSRVRRRTARSPARCTSAPGAQ